MDFTNTRMDSTGLISKLWERGQPANAIVPLDSQLPLAGAALVVSGVLGYLSFQTKCSACSAVYLALLALALSFAAVFIVDGVRVYTG